MRQKGDYEAVDNLLDIFEVQTETLPASRFDGPEGPMAWIEGAGRFQLATWS